jgi:hypothetical protein
MTKTKHQLKIRSGLSGFDVVTGSDFRVVYNEQCIPAAWLFSRTSRDYHSSVFLGAAQSKTNEGKDSHNRGYVHVLADASINLGFVLVGDRADRGWKREHEVEIRHRQKVGFAGRKPGVEGETYRRQWRWAIQAFVFGSLATAVVLLSMGIKDRFFALYSFSGAVGWLAGAIAYCSVLYAYQRQTKQRHNGNHATERCLSPR